MTKLFLTFVLSAFMTLSYATESCVPENNLYISADAKGVTMTVEQFNKDIDNIENIYKKIIKEQFKADLKVFRKWDDGTVNAYAKRSGDTWEVHMFGGLARHEAVTDDGFMAVICHEVGHHIGGAPKIKRFFSTWASNEGQSDYFATTKCLRKYFEKDLEETLSRYNAVTEDEQSLIAKAKCDKTYKQEARAAICYRASLAGQSLATLLGSLRNSPEPKFDTPDPAIVDKTDDKHPAAQCRMDTYFQGALCDKSHEVDPDQAIAATGFCMRAEYKEGIRPLCWYKPEE